MTEIRNLLGKENRVRLGKYIFRSDLYYRNVKGIRFPKSRKHFFLK